MCEGNFTLFMRSKHYRTAVLRVTDTCRLCGKGPAAMYCTTVQCNLEELSSPPSSEDASLTPQKQRIACCTARRPTFGTYTCACAAHDTDRSFARSSRTKIFAASELLTSPSALTLGVAIGFLELHSKSLAQTSIQ